MIVDASDDENRSLVGHGHQAINVMSATANNSSGIYDGVSYARATNRRVVFQGGIQGESWLNHGGNEAQLRQLIAQNSDIALFAVAAGNGAVDIDDPYTNPGYSGGVARLQTHYDNVMAVGAARPGGASNDWWSTGVGVAYEDSLINATEVSRADYSNYGNSLTMVAATDSPAFNKLGELVPFGGTSAANPNMAGIASLVWSVNPDLDAGAVRQILTDTAMDLGIAGRDTHFGHGLVNADAAVRRAWALQQDSLLAGMHGGDSLFAA